MYAKKLWGFEKPALQELKPHRIIKKLRRIFKNILMTCFIAALLAMTGSLTHYDVIQLVLWLFFIQVFELVEVEGVGVPAADFGQVDYVGAD